MTRKRFHGLKKVKVRATWNKYNLYNLTRLRPQFTLSPTYYQQKWAAKSMSRAYHGEQVREKQWERMFTSRLNAVVPIDHKYLAEHDGSELAAGTGSGLSRPKDHVSKPNKMIPYMHMTYAPLERRLDTAIFRALFASSARQARQLVVHGQVRVNGQKMPYPGYLLNPGDMFQVDPERVLFATGESKAGQQAKEGRRIRRLTRRTNTSQEEKRAAARAKHAAKATKEPTIATRSQPQRAPPTTEVEERKERRIQFQELLKKARAHLANPKITLGGKKKQEVREYIKELKTAMGKTSRTDLKAMEENLIAFADRLPHITGEALIPKRLIPKDVEKIDHEEYRAKKQLALTEAMLRIRENPIDDTKPYATPWRPRPFMSPFAFIPRYLEVNQKICSAVYLRHPVGRPGLAEVPTPFGGDTQQLAFNWYLRRR